MTLPLITIGVAGGSGGGKVRESRSFAFGNFAFFSHLK
jgi:hypothetical protein